VAANLRQHRLQNMRDGASLDLSSHSRCIRD
jgi:hypothetical protein